jgi:hypothetical protein
MIGCDRGDEHRPRVTLKNLQVRATFLVDGFVAGTWKSERKRKTAVLVIEPFAAVAKRMRTALDAGRGTPARISRGGCGGRGDSLGDVKGPSMLRERGGRNDGTLDATVASGQLLASWAAYWAGLAGVTLGPLMPAVSGARRTCPTATARSRQGSTMAC